jgi:hypothetical protein
MFVSVLRPSQWEFDKHWTHWPVAGLQIKLLSSVNLAQSAATEHG